MEYNFVSPIFFHSYAFKTPNDNECKDPTAWKLYADDDAGLSKKVASEYDDSKRARNSFKEYELGKKMWTKKIRLEISRTMNPSCEV